MAFKVLFIVRAPGSNPKSDNSILQNKNIEVHTLAFDLNDTDGIIETCTGYVMEKGIHAIVLCPAVSNELVADISKRVENKAAVFVGRGDFKSVSIASEITKNEWFK